MKSTGLRLFASGTSPNRLTPPQDAALLHPEEIVKLKDKKAMQNILTKKTQCPQHHFGSHRLKWTSLQTSTAPQQERVCFAQKNRGAFSCSFSCRLASPIPPRSHPSPHHRTQFRKTHFSVRAGTHGVSTWCELSLSYRVGPRNWRATGIQNASLTHTCHTHIAGELAIDLVLQLSMGSVRYKRVYTNNVNLFCEQPLRLPSSDSHTRHTAHRRP